ncbi:WD40 repeat domain-containing protein [Chlorogloeopsis sp. ULAP01]|uniref:WD40 repeat domain-containing protein n=1 Tax=Chlorogloeopsis sp. ULAP01 TaxID=3056483 RepID=UPI0025AB5566|nr:WD40 repeat domain-containing protein [Chlorogloeopsis sp. ULAP01]MDM9384987.1 WD40 repeat domain-containing protein [Chlorogloeopsis sp. ULAP01]
MEQGLRLLLQLVLEFAPVIASLVQKSNEVRQETNKDEYPRHIQEIIHTVNSASQRLSLLEGFEAEKNQHKEQQQLAVFYRQTQLQIATQEQETALKLPEIQKIFESWPLRLYPSQILNSVSKQERKPLKIFLAPPKVKFDNFDTRPEEISTNLELKLAEGLRDFLGKHYSLQDIVRPTEFLAGAWESKRFHSESSIKALFGILKTEPVLILESEADGDYLNFRIGYWGIEQEHYYYKTISRIPYKEIIKQSAKNRALEWRKIRDELIALGENLEEINYLGRDNAVNLALLEKEEKWQAKGIDISKLSLQYQVNHQDFEQLCQVLITCHCLVAGWVADVYHLVHHDVPPLLPELLPSLINSPVDLQSLQAIAQGYQQVYQALERERRDWIPDLALQLAHSFSHLSDRSLAHQQIEYSIKAWLQLRQIGAMQVNNPLQSMRSAARIEDTEYFQKLREYFAVIGDSQSITQVEEILYTIANLKSKRQENYAYLSHTLNGHIGKITSLAISPSGLILVSGSADKTIKLWDLNTGKSIRTLNDNLGEVSSVAISPDGNFLAIGSCQHPKSNVKVWHLATGKLLHTLLGHQKPVNFVTISPDGLILASGSNKIKIWNLHKGDRICTLWHASSVHAAAINADGSILASGSSDSKIRLWNPRTGEPLRTLNGHTGEVHSVAIHPHGSILFSGSADNTIKIWDLDSGRMLHTFTGHSDEVKSVTISPDGHTLFSGSADNAIKIWCLQSGELLQTLTGHAGTVNTIAVSPDGKFLVSGSSDQTIKIWQVV